MPFDPVSIKAVLWDLDHTILRSKGKARQAWELAFTRVAGVALPTVEEQRGATATQLIDAYLQRVGLPPTQERRAAFTAELGQTYRRLLVEDPADAEAMPGAAQVLAALDGRSLFQSVVTGNTRLVAIEKLRSATLSGWLCIEAGAYGDESGSRSELVRLAVRRAADRIGSRLDPSHLVVIGDAVADMRAAREVGLPSIGIATDAHGAALLRAAGATEVVRRIEEILGMICGAGGTDHDS